MLECCYYTVKTQIIGLCAMSLDLPPLVTSVFLFYFMSPKGAEQLCFCCVFSPILRWEPSRSNPKELLQNTTHLFTEVSNEARARVWSNILEAHRNTNSVSYITHLSISPHSVPPQKYRPELHRMFPTIWCDIERVASILLVDPSCPIRPA